MALDFQSSLQSSPGTWILLAVWSCCLPVSSHLVWSDLLNHLPVVSPSPFHTHSFLPLFFLSFSFLLASFIILLYSSTTRPTFSWPSSIHPLIYPSTYHLPQAIQNCISRLEAAKRLRYQDRSFRLSLPQPIIPDDPKESDHCKINPATVDYYITPIKHQGYYGVNFVQVPTSSSLSLILSS